LNPISEKNFKRSKTFKNVEKQEESGRRIWGANFELGRTIIWSWNSRV